MITSTSASRSRAADGQHHLLGGLPTLGQGVPDHDLHGRPPAAGVLHHVAFGGAASAGDQADGAGQERQPLLVVPLEQALGLQQPFGLLEASQQLALADRGDGVAVEREATVLLVVRRASAGRPRSRPRSAARRRPPRWPARGVTDADTFASLSRMVTKTVRLPARRLISITCASTQIAPSRSIQPRTADVTTRSGCGFSADDSMGTGGRLLGRLRQARARQQPRGVARVVRGRAWPTPRASSAHT